MKRPLLKSISTLQLAAVIAVVAVSAAILVVAIYRPATKKPITKNPLAHLPAYDKAVLYKQLIAKCTISACTTGWLKKDTQSYGPQAGLDVLGLLVDNHMQTLVGDEHQRAHEIGRQTAQTFGLDAKAFLTCSTAYHNGCQHGFFEYGLSHTASAKEATLAICGSLKVPRYSFSFISNCYHGAGHGIMMAQAYDVAASLGVCDSLDPPGAAQGCWQGVFMENVNAGMRHEARDGQFVASDPLLPCRAVAGKYQSECYINHAGWLMSVFDNDIVKASTACLSALPDNSCLRSIGLMVSNTNWQSQLAEASGVTVSSPEVTAWDLCQKFPAGHIADCSLAGVDNLLNTNTFDTKSAAAYCAVVDASVHDGCYRQIGVAAAQHFTKPGDITAQCNNLPIATTRELCSLGGGIKP